MLNMKKRLAALVALIMLMSICIPVPAAAEGETAAPVLCLTDGSAPKGELVTLELRMENGTDISGGSLDIVYDPSLLTLEEAKPASLDGTLILSNVRFRPDTVRVTVASSGVLPETCTLLTLKFRISRDAPPGELTAALKNTRLLRYDRTVENTVTVDHTVQDGTITVQHVVLRIAETQAVGMQALRVQVHLEGDLRPAGGNMVIRYDPTWLAVGNVVSAPNLNGKTLLTANCSNPGEIRLCMAGAEPVAKGALLCTLTFQVDEHAPLERFPITFEHARVYDTQGTAMDLITKNGGVTILPPNDVCPKLWVAGGQVGPDGLAEVNVVIEGRSVVCGGTLSLSYDDTKCQLLPERTIEHANNYGAVCINKPVDNFDGFDSVVFTWAGATASHGSQMLLTLCFRVWDHTSPLTFSDVRVLDKEGNPVTPVDIRNGTFRQSDVPLQPPYADEVAFIPDDDITMLNFIYDIAMSRDVDPGILPGEEGTPALSGMSGRAGKPEGGKENYTVFAAFYCEGRMVSSKFISSAEGIRFDENGIATLPIRTSCAARADTVKIFVFPADGTMVPCTESITLTAGA